MPTRIKRTKRKRLIKNRTRKRLIKNRTRKRLIKNRTKRRIKAGRHKRTKKLTGGSGSSHYNRDRSERARALLELNRLKTILIEVNAPPEPGLVETSARSDKLRKKMTRILSEQIKEEEDTLNQLPVPG